MPKESMPLQQGFNMEELPAVSTPPAHTYLREARKRDGMDLPPLKQEGAPVRLSEGSFLGRFTEKAATFWHSRREEGDIAAVCDMRTSLAAYASAVSKLTGTSFRFGNREYRISPVLFSEGGFLDPLVEQTSWMMAYLYLLRHHDPAHVQPSSISISGAHPSLCHDLLSPPGLREFIGQADDESLALMLSNVVPGVRLRDAVHRLWDFDIDGMITPFPQEGPDFLNPFLEVPLVGEVTAAEWMGTYLPAAYRFITAYFREEAIRVTVSLMTITRLLGVDILRDLGGTVLPGVRFDLVPEDHGIGPEVSDHDGESGRDRKADVLNHGTSSDKFMRFDGLHIAESLSGDIKRLGADEGLKEYPGEQLAAALVAQGITEVGLIEIKTRVPVWGQEWHPPTSASNRNRAQALWYASTFSNWADRLADGKIRITYVIFIFIAPAGVSVLRIPFAGEGDSLHLDLRQKEVLLPL